MRQAQTYWDAGGKTRGSAAALLYYYGALQLAKAELLQSHPAAIQAGNVHHGLRKVRSSTQSIRSDYLVVTDGVFRMLYEKRTGRSLPVGTRLRMINMLSLIPEIGLEMQEMSPTRPPSSPGYYPMAISGSEAWTVVMTYLDLAADARERAHRTFLSAYEEVAQSDFPEWRSVFAMSSRTIGGSVRLYQSKRTMSQRMPDGTVVPDTNKAIALLIDTMGDHISAPIGQSADFLLTPTVSKTDPLLLPLDLIRYAAMFYLSSLVRYSPAALDPASEGEQAYLMDSFANEVPLPLLVGAIDGLLGQRSYFEPGNFRL